jgi:hypothetical protein
MKYEKQAAIYITANYYLGTGIVHARSAFKNSSSPACGRGRGPRAAQAAWGR